MALSGKVDEPVPEITVAPAFDGRAMQIFQDEERAFRFMVCNVPSNEDILAH